MRRKALLALALGAALFAQSASPSLAAIAGGLSFVGDSAAQDPSIVEAQFIFGGRQYCWYDNGWRGPGWYWCGYAYRRGYGWGGGVGWNHWRHYGHGGHRPGHGGGRPHGGHGGGHRHGGHGGGHRGGGHGGGHRRR